MRNILKISTILVLFLSFYLVGCKSDGNIGGNTAKYKVIHLQEKIDSEEFITFETENKTGKIGDNTEATPKQYDGFVAQSFEQTKIKADGSTVVEIKYKRNIVSLILDLAGGTTTTTLENGKDGKKLLKGKFKANVKITEPTRDKHTFVAWTPALPSTFPALSPTQVYKAQWKENDDIVVTIKADERFDVSKPSTIKIPKSSNKKWADIKKEANAKLTLKSDWDKNDYGLYDWKIEKYEGVKLTDDYPITKDITVFARSNYIPFQFQENNTKIYYFLDDHPPKGRIIIPKGIKILGNQCLGYAEITHVDFSDVNLKEMQKACLQVNPELDDIDLSTCTDLTMLGGFRDCLKLKTIDFSKCKKLTTITGNCFRGCTGLTGIMDLSQFSNLTLIVGGAFAGCTNLIVKLPSSIKRIESEAFGDPSYAGAQYCKQVIVPNQAIKKLVKDVNYPEERILVQP